MWLSDVQITWFISCKQPLTTYAESSNFWREKLQAQSAIAVQCFAPCTTAITTFVHSSANFPYLVLRPRKNASDFRGMFAQRRPPPSCKESGRNCIEKHKLAKKNNRNLAPWTKEGEQLNRLKSREHSSSIIGMKTVELRRVSCWSAVTNIQCTLRY